MPVWWNGRHKGLKIPRWQQRARSSRVTGTKTHQELCKILILLRFLSFLPGRAKDAGFLIRRQDHFSSFGELAFRIRFNDLNHIVPE